MSPLQTISEDSKISVKPIRTIMKRHRCAHHKPYPKTATSPSNPCELWWRDSCVPITDRTWRRQQTDNKPRCPHQKRYLNTATSPSNPNQFWGRRQWRPHHKLYLKTGIFPIKPKSTLTYKTVTSPSQTISEDTWIQQHPHQIQTNFEEEDSDVPNTNYIWRQESFQQNPNKLWRIRQWYPYHKLYLKTGIFPSNPNQLWRKRQWKYIHIPSPVWRELEPHQTHLKLTLMKRQ